MRWQGKSKRKMTGGKNTFSRGKRKYEIGRESTETKIGIEKKKLINTRGGNRKLRIMSSSNINVTDKKTGCTKKVELKTVKENEANKHYIRRNIVTMGSIIQTEIGLVRVTSRPGQDGIINGVLIE